MKLSKKIGISLALMTLGTLVAVACNDSTSGSCTSACQHDLSCQYAALIDAGLGSFITDAGSFCQDSCNNTDGGLGDTSGCTNPGAGYDCVNGLSCADLIGSGTGLSPALLACQQKAGCDAG